MLFNQNVTEKFERPLAILFVVAILMACASFTVKLGTDFNSSTVAQIFILVFAGIAVSAPRAAIVLTFVYLAVLGDIRRWFQTQFGISDFDLLLLVGPITALILVARPFFHGQLNAGTKVSKWVMILMGIMTLQIFNIAYVPIQVNLAGVMFYMIPLVWFLIGKVYGTEEFTEKVLFSTVFLVAIAACAFGLYQAFVGFPDYQLAWIRQNAAKGLISLNVGNRVRPFGFFVSFQEYAQYLTAMIGIALAGIWFSRLRWMALFLPLPLVAVLTTGARGPVVNVMLAVGLVYILLAKGGVTIVGRLVAYGFVGAAAMFFGFTAASQTDFGEDINPLIQRQAEGLLNPLDTRKSTATDHGLIFLSGMISSLSDFAGKGLGSTSIAGGKFGVDTSGTEIDVSNMFVALSPVGGIIYVVLICIIFKRAGLFLRHKRSAVSIAIMGLLITQFGQWLTGNLYALSALVWFCIGAIDRQAAEFEKAQLPESSPSVPKPFIRRTRTSLASARQAFDARL